MKPYSILFMKGLLGSSVSLVTSCGESHEDDTWDYVYQESDPKDFVVSYMSEMYGFVINDYLGHDKEIWIPKETTFDGVTAPIIEIGRYAFLNRDVETIHLSESVRNLDSYCFYNSKLKHLYVTPSLVSISTLAFDNCPIEFYTKDHVKYLPGRYGKYGCAVSYEGPESAEITLPDSCEGSFNTVFIGKQRIKVGPKMVSYGSIARDARYIPYDKSQTTLYSNKLGHNALTDWTHLEKVIMDHSVIYLNARAFNGCTNLKTLDIVNAIPSIGAETFEGCDQIEVNYHGTLAKWLRPLKEAYPKKGYHLYLDDSGKETTEVVCDFPYVQLGSYAFLGCKYLTSITLPETLINISSYDFAYCDSLKSLQFPPKIAKIGYGAFKGSVSIETLDLPKNLTVIEGETFMMCGGLKSISLPAGLTQIGARAFKDCPKLSQIIIPESVTTIKDEAFAGCDQLTIYFESDALPEDLPVNWNPLNRPVVLGYGNNS